MFSLFNKKFDLAAEIATLYQEVDTIGQLKEMVASPVWRKIHDWAIGRIVDSDAAIVSLCENPTKNDTEIRNRRAFRSALKELLSCVETTLISEKEIRDKLKLYEETSRLAERK